MDQHAVQNLRNWLGDVDATDEQEDAMLRLQRDINEQLSDDREIRYDQQDEFMEAFVAGVQVILGDTTTAEVVDEWQDLRVDLEHATNKMRGALLVELQISSEREVAAKYKINRKTVRKAQGK